MDGNGRWATGRGMPRIMGHRAGVEAARRVVEAAPDAGVGILTLFAFSSDNWRRPAAEVDALMRLMADLPANETSRCVEQGVRLEVIGRRDRLGAKRCSAIAQAEAATAAGGSHVSSACGRLLGAGRNSGRRSRSAGTLPNNTLS